jgi:hypothetical protein
VFSSTHLKNLKLLIYKRSSLIGLQLTFLKKMLLPRRLDLLVKPSTTIELPVKIKEIPELLTLSGLQELTKDITVLLPHTMDSRAPTIPRRRNTRMPLRPEPRIQRRLFQPDQTCHQAQELTLDHN